MTMIFLFCAIVGGTVLICQFVLTLIGLGDHGGDLSVDAPHDFDAGMHNGSGMEHAGDTHLDSSWLFNVVSFRTIVAAVTFFGIFGMIGQSAQLNLPLQVLMALVGGVAAMYGVAWLMNSLRRLGQDSTLRIENAIGKIGTVYVPIPAHKAEAGQIQITVQQRLVELPAVTGHPAKLPTGAKVLVVGLVGQGTLEVKPVDEVVPASGASAKSATA
jgi:membrane protein implicated in regulation of membrane protease activity